MSIVAELRRSFSERELMIYSSATAFHILSSIVPFLLFALAAIGFLQLQEVWTNDIASHIKPQVSKAAYTVIDDTAEGARPEADLVGDGRLCARDLADLRGDTRRDPRARPGSTTRRIGGTGSAPFARSSPCSAGWWPPSCSGSPSV